MLGTESCLPCHPHALAPKECGQPATLVSLGWLLTGPGGNRGLSAGPQAAANEPLRRALPLGAAECGWFAGLFLWPQPLPHLPPSPYSAPGRPLSSFGGLRRSQRKRLITMYEPEPWEFVRMCDVG